MRLITECVLYPNNYGKTCQARKVPILAISFPKLLGLWNYHATCCSLCWFSLFSFLINEYKTKKNFVTQSINLNFCKIIFSSYLTQWHSTLIKVTCPMNVHEFQCWHRSLLFHDRIGFEKAALEDEYFSTQETHLPSSDL